MAIIGLIMTEKNLEVHGSMTNSTNWRKWSKSPPIKISLNRTFFCKGIYYMFHMRIVSIDLTTK